LPARITVISVRGSWRGSRLGARVSEPRRQPVSGTAGAPDGARPPDQATGQPDAAATAGASATDGIAAGRGGPRRCRVKVERACAEGRNRGRSGGRQPEAPPRRQRLGADLVRVAEEVNAGDWMGPPNVPAACGCGRRQRGGSDVAGTRTADAGGEVRYRRPAAGGDREARRARVRVRVGPRRENARFGAREATKNPWMAAGREGR